MNEIHIRDTALIRRGLVADPKAKHYRRMRQALWLYLFLLLAAQPRSGRRLLDPKAVAQAMGLKEATIRSWLGHLRRYGYLTSEREGRLVWIQLAKWRPNSRNRDSEPQSPDPGPAGVGSPLEAIELARALGEPSDSKTIDDLLVTYSPDVLKAALNKVQKVPESQIRKSRLALFRYFLRQTK